MASCRRAAGEGAAVAALSLTLTFIHLAQAAPGLASNGPALLPPEGGTYGPRTAMTVLMPASLDGIDPATIRFELDRIDVTDILARDGNRVIVEPADVLAPGPHQLVIIGRTTAGADVEIARWTITVAGAPADGTSFALQANNTAQALLLLRDGNVDKGRDRLGANGAGDMRLEAQAGNWQMTSNINYFLETERRLAVTGEVLDLGEHTTALNYTGTGWAAGIVAGHHDPGYDTMLMSGFSRRGVSAQAGFGGGRVVANAFSLSSAGLLGSDDPFGFGDSSGHVTGTGATVRPFDLDGNELAITGLAYFGRQGVSPGTSTGVGDATVDRGDGRGFGFAMNSAWMDRRLLVDGDWARTDYDADGKGTAAERDGAAYGLRASYDLLRDGPAFMRIGGGWERVGTFYYSVANPGLAKDRESLFATTDFVRDSLSLSARVRRDDSNIEELPNVPTDRSYSGGIDGRYDIAIARTDAGDRAWLGQPFVLFGGSTQFADRLKTPTGYAGQDTDQRLISLYLGAGSNYPAFGWQALFQHSSLNDEANNANDLDSSLGQLVLSWFPDEQFSLNATLQVNRSVQGANDATKHNINALVGLRTVLIPDELDLALDINSNLLTGSGDTPDTNLFNGELLWTLQRAEVNRPGYALAVRGSVETNHGNTVDNQNRTAYQSFLVLRISAPLAFH